jgi:hypothetical protein
MLPDGHKSLSGIPESIQAMAFYCGQMIAWRCLHYPGARGRLGTHGPQWEPAIVCDKREYSGDGSWPGSCISLFVIPRGPRRTAGAMWQDETHVVCKFQE